MSDSTHCDLCSREIPPHGHYVVRIDVYADPALPATSAEELAGLDFDQTMRDLMEQMKDLSAEELQDQVHRRFEYKLCPACQRQYLANPLGRPRNVSVGRN